MLKDTDRYENSSHFTYSDYKRKVKKSPNKDLRIFVSVFIVGVLIILGFAKILSPNVDVAITNENENAASSAISDSDEEANNSVIDDRLKHIKMEDEGKKVGDNDMFSPELDEKVVLPNHKKKTTGQMEAEMADYMNAQKAEQQQPKQDVKPQVVDNHKTTATAPAPQEKKIQSTPQPAQIVNARVVVGYYATEKQAEVAKSIIQDAGVGVSPVVKNLGGYYTLQVGSYSSREKAQQAANNLLKNNFPARVIVD